jgi:DNA mismatch endonuclease (patch repair protein)
MTDVFDKAQRSKIMSRVRSRENKNTEVAVVMLFRKHAITGWRRRARVFGSPDFVFRKQHVAVFVDGCFWHGCPKHRSVPTSNVAFWRRKLQRNKRRDRLVRKTLRKHGWKVLRIWQHELTRANQARLIRRVRRSLVAKRLSG